MDIKLVFPTLTADLRGHVAKAVEVPLAHLQAEVGYVGGDELLIEGALRAVNAPWEKRAAVVQAISRWRSSKDQELAEALNQARSAWAKIQPRRLELSAEQPLAHAPATP